MKEVEGNNINLEIVCVNCARFEYESAPEFMNDCPIKPLRVLCDACTRHVEKIIEFCCDKRTEEELHTIGYFLKEMVAFGYAGAECLVNDLSSEEFSLDEDQFKEIIMLEQQINESFVF